MNEEKKNLIAYCGLYCGDCSIYEGRIADLARDLRKELREARFDKTAKALSGVSFFKIFNNYPQCYEVLGAMVKLRCGKICKDGGGPPFCKIRKCCQKKGFDGCWECEEFETCEKLDFLKPGHGGARIKNIRKISKQGTQEFLKGEKYWYVNPK
ncbi:MAG: DUF3795 domain-containing protein [Thermodesulfobacteriota bacterium]